MCFHLDVCFGLDVHLLSSLSALFDVALVAMEFECALVSDSVLQKHMETLLWKNGVMLLYFTSGAAV